MHKHLLTPLAAAAVAAGALTLAAPEPAGATAWLENGSISDGIAGNASSLDVASTGPGDALAAWTVPVGDIDRVYVARAVNGDWSAPTPLSTVGQDTADVHVAADEHGRAVVTWEQPGGGIPNGRVLVGRRLAGGTWGPITNLVPTPSDAGLFHDVAMDAAGDAVVSYRIADDADSTALVSDWPRQGDVTSSVVDPGQTDEFFPGLASNASGDVLVTFARNGSIFATYRAAGSSSWTDAKAVVSNIKTAWSWPALRPNGSGVVAGIQDGTPDVVRVREIGANGAPGLSTAVSDPANPPAYSAQATTNGDGDVLLAWETVSAEGRGIDYASRPAGGAYTSATTLAAPIYPGGNLVPLLALTDDDVRVVAASRAASLRVWHRTTGVQAQWEDHDAGPTDGPTAFALDSDSEGNAVVIGSGANLVHAEFLDSSGPVTKVVKPARAITVTTEPVVGWSTSDSLSAVAPTVDVYATSAAWNTGDFSDPVLIADGATGDQLPFAATPGTTYCFQVRSQDTSGNFTNAQPRCSTVPLDDRKLAGEGWTRAEGSGHFLDTVTRTSQQGRTLVRKGVRADRLALVVHKTLQSGTVKVTFGDQNLGTFSLKGKGKRRVVNLATFPTVRTGTVRITVTSKGKPVTIDGLVAAK